MPRNKSNMCPLTNGEHAVFEEGKLTIVPDITIKMFTLTDFLMTSKMVL